MTDRPLPTRKDFLRAVAGSALLPVMAESQPSAAGKLLIVAAHPDDEYAFAAATYRLARECGWTVDQAIVTNGESGYRYSTLAETYYGVSLAPTNEGRARLAQIRKQEALNAGRVLGIRRHYFLDQRDLGFTTDASAASTENWDRAHVRSFLADLLSREKYDAVFTLLPTAETHGHHRAATLLALEAVSRAEGTRPLILGADARASQGPQLSFAGLPGEPLTRVASQAPTLAFDRNTPFGYRDALNYQIVVNWLIAEHKSQGLFQTDFSQDRFEEFWAFQVSGADAGERVSALGRIFGKAAC